MERIKLHIDHKLCKECGICLEECPNHKNKPGHKHVDHDYELCDRCLHCYAVCNEHAITADGSPLFRGRIKIEPESMLSHLMHRRSYRRFRQSRLKEEEIQSLLDAANYIPSGGNDHRLNITVLTSESKRTELLAAISFYYGRIKKLLKNPVLQLIARHIGDEKVRATLRDQFYLNKILGIIENIDDSDDPVFYHAPAVFIFHTGRLMPTAKEDCILSAYNVVLMSETLGLGSCFVSLSQQAITNDKVCKSILSIPHSHKVEAVVAVGYPKRIYKRPVPRNSKLTKII